MSNTKDAVWPHTNFRLGGSFTANSIKIKYSGNSTYALPTTAGTSGNFLKTNGNGTTTWASVSGGASDYSIQTSGSASVTAEDDADLIILTNTGNSTVTLNLPLISTLGKKEYKIVHAHASNEDIITVKPNASDTIVGIADPNGFEFSGSYSSITVINDNSSEWFVL